MKIKHPERICVVVPAADAATLRAIAAQRETTFSEEMRRAARAHVKAETRRLGIPF